MVVVPSIFLAVGRASTWVTAFVPTESPATLAWAHRRPARTCRAAKSQLRRMVVAPTIYPLPEIDSRQLRVLQLLVDDVPKDAQRIEDVVEFLGA